MPSLCSLFNNDEEAEEMNVLSEIDDVPLKKGKPKLAIVPKSSSSKKKGGKSQGSATKKLAEKSLAPPASIVHNEQSDSPMLDLQLNSSDTQELQGQNNLDSTPVLPRPKSPHAPSVILDAEQGNIRQFETQDTISDDSSGEFLLPNSEEVNASQKSQDSPISPSLKRTADSSLENPLLKAPKLTSRDNHDVSMFLANMQERSIEVEQLYAFLKLLPGEFNFLSFVIL
ncbi:hypothetical protein BDR07DRAFT_1480394 [Suillus spraguei]|nr:hypothetical protein BDR07DRAFT_1480394 [Suillus spraguei]